MKLLLATAFAAVYGLILRLLFVSGNDLLQVMSITFLFLVPMVIGFLTIMLTPSEKTATGTAAFFKPWLTSLVLLVGTIMLQIEGTICWIMVFPIFATFAGLGGLLAFKLRKSKTTGASNKWQRPNTLNVSLLFVAPLALGLVEGEKASAPEQLVIQREVIIPASTAAVWKELTTNQRVSPHENPTSFATLLGFPNHVATTLDTLVVGGKRMAYYEKGLYFEETVSQYQPERLLALRINANPDSIPAAVMDEHILIGGKHLDILEDIYELKPLPDGSTRLTLSSRFYINTPFNWYAGMWAHYLMADILQSELELLKKTASHRP